MNRSNLLHLTVAAPSWLERDPEPERPPEPWYLLPIDPAQTSDFCAAPLIRRRWMAPAWHYDVWPFRYPQQVSYPAMVDDLLQRLRSPELHGHAWVIIERNGVGAPFRDLFLTRQRWRPPYEILPRTIITTGGEQAIPDPELVENALEYSVPKTELVAYLKAVIGQGRLKVAANHPLAATLVDEFRDFEARVRASGRVQYAAKSGSHDDLLMAMAMGIWWGERPLGRSQTDVGVTI